ncbi:hypothetical protein LXA43DRAFT_459338 [Ganoderma leucocontextum]|nr:hypothetical protein LXA43DRAFT_459338 [Ganoderma leucocontextum]
MKSKEEVIAQFNEEVNMTAEELEAWLEDPKSATAGTGVGVESGHKIVEILKKNPTKDPEKYGEEDLAHMRKVVGYNKRHLAQEDHLKETKTREELEHVKSTISLKNWGHVSTGVIVVTVERLTRFSGSSEGPGRRTRQCA